MKNLKKGDEIIYTGETNLWTNPRLSYFWILLN